MIADLPGIVIPSVAIPPGTAYSEREVQAQRALLRANGHDDTASGYRGAARADQPALRAAAFALLARDASDDDRVLFAQGAGDSDLAVRAYAAYGLERVAAGQGVPVLRDVAAHAPGFGEYGPLIAAALLAQLGDASGFPTVERAFATLGETHPVVDRLWPFARLRVPGVWPLYDRALASSDLVVREQALAQLREVGAPEAAPAVARLLARLPADDPWAATVRELASALEGW